jgi:hypothetical protein
MQCSKQQLCSITSSLRAMILMQDEKVRIEDRQDGYDFVAQLGSAMPAPRSRENNFR